MKVCISCPYCKRGLQPIPFYKEAVIISKRKCRYCKSYWQVKTTPKKIKQGYVHFSDFVETQENGLC